MEIKTLRFCTIPAEMFFEEKIRIVADLAPGEHAWCSVWGDRNGMAFVYAHDPIFENPTVTATHMIINKGDGVFAARLMTTRARRIDAAMAGLDYAWPIDELEL